MRDRDLTRLRASFLLNRKRKTSLPNKTGFAASGKRGGKLTPI